MSTNHKYIKTLFCTALLFTSVYTGTAKDVDSSFETATIILNAKISVLTKHYQDNYEKIITYNRLMETDASSNQALADRYSSELSKLEKDQKFLEGKISESIQAYHDSRKSN